jgi:hypothetical protein
MKNSLVIIGDNDMKATIRIKGGEGSGFHGHAGIPGHQGGSQAESSGNTDLDRLSSYVSTVSHIRARKNDLSYANSAMKRYEKIYFKNTRDASAKHIYESARDRYYKTKEEYDAANAEFKKKYKGVVKAPGYGEWKPESKGSHIAGSSTSYSHPEHPEWGTVEIYKFGGWSMQRVAANASVKWNGIVVGEWSGSSARDRANALAHDMFGI